MQAETAKMLVESISSVLAIAIDNRNKITALEIVLRKHDYNLNQEYEETLAKVRRNAPTVASPLAFSNLQSKLAQE